jgi:predicted Zn-dependent peptidase
MIAPSKTAPWAVLLALAPSTPASAALPAQGASPLAHERYQLENGMQVILAPDRSAPQAVVNLWYRVGSKDEPKDRTGFAHLFEHLMFMGTERAPNFDVIMEAGGAANNASTSIDRTNYYDWGPSSELPTLLWLEADRLERLDQVMTQDKLEIQRGVVLNEYRQNYENQPYGMGQLAISQLLYPPDHPYHISTIGRPEHIEAATLEDVIGFFQTFYVPCNASLVVAGDFDPAAIKPLIADLFGTLPRGDDPPRQEVPPITLDQTVRRILVDDVRLPLVHMAWHSPKAYERGDAELDLLAGLLAEAPAGRLYRRLVVDEALCSDVAAFQYPGSLGSSFHIQAYALPDVDLAQVERAIEQVLRDVAGGAIGEAEMAPFKAAYELRLLRPVDSLRARADLLNHYAFHFGEPDSLERDLERYRRIDANGLRSLASGVFSQNGRAILHVVPQLAEPEVNPRDTRPAPLASGRLALDGQALELGPGLGLTYFERAAAPFTALRLLLPFGSGLDGPGREGAVSLLFDLLDEGATLPDGEQLDAEAFAQRLRRLGATLDLRVSDDSTLVSLDVLHQNADAAIELLESALLRPNLSAADFKRLAGQRLETLRSEGDDPARVAGRVQRAVWFGLEHPFGHPPEGSVAGLEALELSELQSLHGRLLAGGGELFCAAAWKPEEAQRRLAAGLAGLVGRRGQAPAMVLPAAPRPAQDLRIVLVDAPGTTQTQVRFLTRAVPPASPERLDLELITTVLGGTFSSRLNMNLREAKNWTYGASARYAPYAGVAYLAAGASVQVDATGPAIAEFLHEFGRLSSPDLTAEEDQKARRSLAHRVVEAAASSGGLCEIAATQRRLGLGLSDLTAFLAATESPRLAEMRALAPRAFRPELLLLVGDREAVLGQLGELAKQELLDLARLTELDGQGRPLTAGK